MNRASTEYVLGDWRYGQPQAERLCSGLLSVEGFQEIDPQSPLGGPDGKKDILCKRDDLEWVCAVYFPTTRSDFPGIRGKFREDLSGVSQHNRSAFAFFTNQKLSPGERGQLVSLADRVRVELYHQERIRAILDSPRGYGLRLEYLRIPMTEEEQVGLFSSLGDEITARLMHQEAEILALHRKLDYVIERTLLPGGTTLGANSSIEHGHIPALSQFPTADLQMRDILWIHRIVSEGSPRELQGRFRSTMVWIGKPGESESEARFVPTPPERIYAELSNATDQWRANFDFLASTSEAERVSAVAEFHHRFLSIHPFLDCNGRVARALLQQQVLDLTGRRFTARFTAEPKTYYDTLSAADNGDIQPLVNLITANLE